MILGFLKNGGKKCNNTDGNGKIYMHDFEGTNIKTSMDTYLNITINYSYEYHEKTAKFFCNFYFLQKIIFSKMPCHV